MADLLSYLGISNVGNMYHNLSNPALYEEAIPATRRRWPTSVPYVTRTGTYRDGRPATSSSCESRRVRTGFGGVTTTARSNPSASTD